MTDSEAYQATLDRLRSDLSKTEATATKLRAGIAAIQDIMNADTLPAAHRNGLSWDKNPETKHITKMREAAIWALNQTGEAMRAREIYDLLMKHGYPYDKGFDVFKGSMIPTLDRGQDFKKIDRGLYDLKDR